MTVTARQWSLAASFALGLAAGPGLGVFRAAADPPQPELKKQAVDTAASTAVLDKLAGIEKPIKGVTIGDLFNRLGDSHGVTFRLDVPLLAQFAFENPYETKVSLPVVKGLTVRDVLQEATSSFNSDQLTLGFSVRGGQVIVTKAFQPAYAPGSYKTGDANKFISEKDIAAVLYGPTVSVAADETPLARVIARLRETSGANIAVDPRVRDKLGAPVTLALNDVKLMTALKIATDPIEVAPAVVDNVYYLTTKENAARLTKETELNMFGEPQVPVPAGFVTDGFHLYERPAGLKPVAPPPDPPPGLVGISPENVRPRRIPESVAKPAAPPPEKK
jgi:hypothetical protein